MSRKELRIPLCYRRFPVERTHAQHLRSFETFHALSDAVLEELAAETRVAEFGEGDRVWNAGDPTPYFTFVSRGLVQIVRANARGEEITLGIFGPGEGIGNLATMEGTPYPAAAVVVSKQCTLRRIPTAVMKASMQHSQGMLVSANRELMAKARALVTKIDMLIATHFHRDHIGGIPELVQRVPVRTFVDYGSAYPPENRAKPDLVDAQDAQAYDDYLPVRSKARHLQPKPGDRLALKGLRTTVVSTNGIALNRPLRNAGDSNQACPPAPRFTSYPGDENLRSVGVVVEYGRFRFLNLGDLNGPPLFDLVCPRDLIGSIDVYLAPHHGGNGAAEPATLAAFRPRSVVVNNAPRKGGRGGMLKMLGEAKDLDAWQLHVSPEGGENNSPPERTANIDPSTAYWLKVRARADGSFSVINGRTGLEKAYPAGR